MATAVDCALPLRSMMPPTESATFPARTTRSGTPSSEPAAAFLVTTSSTESAQLVTPGPNSTIRGASAATASRATRRLQDRDVKANAFPFARPMKITS